MANNQESEGKKPSRALIVAGVVGLCFALCCGLCCLLPSDNGTESSTTTSPAEPGEAVSTPQSDPDTPSKAKRARPKQSRSEYMESLQLQPIRVLTTDAFKRRNGLPEKIRQSEDWAYYYYPKGDFTVQIDLNDEVTVNVYDGRM